MALKDCSKEYADIIDLPYPVSKTRPRMSMHNRAAQFSPFAALTGYNAAIKETERFTDEKIELDESAKAGLDEKLLTIIENLEDKPFVSITYFKKDDRKAGGSYEVINGRIRKIDFYERIVVLEDRSRIFIDDIIDISGDTIFKSTF